MNYNLPTKGHTTDIMHRDPALKCCGCSSRDFQSKTVLSESSEFGNFNERWLSHTRPRNVFKLTLVPQDNFLA